MFKITKKGPVIIADSGSAVLRGKFSWVRLDKQVITVGNQSFSFDSADNAAAVMHDLLRYVKEEHFNDNALWFKNGVLVPSTKGFNFNFTNFTNTIFISGSDWITENENELLDNVKRMLNMQLGDKKLWYYVVNGDVLTILGTSMSGDIVLPKEPFFRDRVINHLSSTLEPILQKNPETTTVSVVGGGISIDKELQSIYVDELELNDVAELIIDGSALLLGNKSIVKELYRRTCEVVFPSI